MSDRRNPYLILGVDHGSDPAQASAAFARKARRVRTAATDADSYSMEDLTWALHQIEQREVDPDGALDHFRVPANHEAYRDGLDVESLLPPTQPLERATEPGTGYSKLEDAVVVEELQAALQAQLDHYAKRGVIEPGPADTATPFRSTPPSPPSLEQQPASHTPATREESAVSTKRTRTALVLIVGSIIFGVGAYSAGWFERSDPEPSGTTVSVSESAREPEPAAEPETEPERALPVGRPTLERGSDGDDTRDLQERLDLAPDGVFGPATEQAVRDFQREQGLEVDGIVGEQTWRALGLIADEAEL